MKNPSSPVSIDTKKTGKAGNTSTRNSAGKSASPAGAKKNASTRSSSRSKATDHPKAKPVRKAVKASEQAVAKSSVAKEPAPLSAPEPRLPENRHNGLHDRSYAAHLNGGAPHTKPANDLRFNAHFLPARKQP